MEVGKTLELRLEEESKKGIWKEENIGRVNILVQYEILMERAGQKRICIPYSILEDIEDFKLYYELHDEWKGKSTSEMNKDKEPGANAFYHSFNRWVHKQTENKVERKRLRQIIFKTKHKWAQYQTIEDWISEYDSHTEWKGKSTYEIQKDNESGANAFYQSFNSWVHKQTEDKNERKELRRKVFVNLR